MRPSLIVPSYFCIGSGIVVSLPATAGECTRPDATALSSEQAKLEGEVRVTVLNVGGGASAAGEQHKEWESQLPSQSAVDNQWYLYYLCQEYEARRITRDQYCAISSGIWERIVGRPVAMGECAGQVPQSTYPVSAPVAAAPAPAPVAAPPPPPPEPSAVVTAPIASASTMVVEAVLPAPAPAPVAVSAPAPAPSVVAPPRGRWTMLTATGSAMDLFGPVRLAGEELWYAENDAGCLSVIGNDNGEWWEAVVVGQCTPWKSLSLAVGGQTVTINADGSRWVFDFVEASPGRLRDGRWAGAIAFTTNNQAAAPPPLWQMLLGVQQAAAGGSFPVELAVDARGGELVWEATGCRTTLSVPRTGPGWVQFTERSDPKSQCIDGAKVTLQALSNDAVLMQWSDGTQSAQGILRPNG